MSFQEDLTKLINQYSKENGSGTPDFILAKYLCECLSTFNAAVNRRESWYGREQDPRFGIPKSIFPSAAIINEKEQP